MDAGVQTIRTRRPPPLRRALTEAVSAGHHDNHVRFGLEDRIPVNTKGRLLRRPENIDATGERDHLGHPVPGYHGRVGPLQTDNARARVHFGNARLDSRDPAAQLTDEIARGVLADRRKSFSLGAVSC